MNSTSDNNSTAQNECILTDDEIQRSYNLTLHIVSVFVLLAVSFIGASISVASARVKALHINPIIINTGKYFGCGVILATAFVHILPDAMATLSDPCLPDSWNVYGAYSGLFAMLAALGMQLIEFLAHQKYRSVRLKHAHIITTHDVKELVRNEETNDKTNKSLKEESINNEIDQPTFMKHEANGIINHVENEEQAIAETEEPNRLEQINETTGKSKKKKRAKHEINNIEDVIPVDNKIEESENTRQTDNNADKPKPKKQKPIKTGESKNVPSTHNHTEVPEQTDQTNIVVIEIPHMESTPTSTDFVEVTGHFHGVPLPEEVTGHFHGAAFQDDGQQNKISTYLLEFGVALHSILIGLTLGTTTDAFVALFIAICFHQFFEAIALGAQIANLKTASIKSAIFMVVFFALTTPIGIAIGIGIHAGTYNPKSVVSLLVTGILDSLSAGILIYVALVNLISAEMGAHAHAFFSLSTRLKVLYFVALYLGVTAMAIIGRWA